MGISLHGLWNYSIWKIELLYFYHHFSPILSVYALLYKIMPFGETLLILQSLSISIAIFPLFAYASDILDKKRAYIVVFMYCLFSPVWLINLINFHVDPLFIPLSLSALYFQKKDKSILFTTSIILLLTIKEISFFIVALTFLYGALKYKKGFYQYLLSCLFLVLGVLLVDSILPSIDRQTLMENSGINWLSHGILEGHTLMDNAGISWMSHDMGGILNSIMSDPLEVAGKVINYWKIIYIIVLFGSFLFVPFLAPLSLLPALPGIALSYLSDLWRMQSLAYHHPSLVIPFVLAAFVEGLATRTFLQKKFLNIVIGCFLIINITHLGFFLLYKNDSYHYSRFFVSQRDDRNRAALKRYIPTDPLVVVSSSNLVNHAILANRINYLEFPAGVININESSVLADYVVYDRKRVDEIIYFFLERGLDRKTNPLAKYELLKKEFKMTFDNFEIIYEYDDFFILKRR
jgi:uncharacterized membrane protein